MAQAFMQNGGRFSTVLDIFNSSSLADMRNKIEQAEDDQSEQEAAASKAQEESMAAQQTLEAEKIVRESDEKRKDRALKKYEIDANILLKRDEMDITSDDSNVNELAGKKLQLDEKINSDNVLLKIKELDQEMLISNNQEKTKRVVKAKTASSNK